MDLENKKLNLGICTRCKKNPQVQGLKRCQKCFDYCRKRDQSLKEKGLCYSCRNPSVKEKIYCENCLEKQKKKYFEDKKISIENGFCPVCNENKPKEGFSLCDKCNEKGREWSNKRRIKKKESWQCGRCMLPAMLNSNVNLCEDCYFLRNSRNALRLSKWECGSGPQVKVLAEQLKQLWYQTNGICDLSGEKLTLGVDSSVDHIVPRTKGGSANIENLRWVHKNVNQMKHDLIDEELMKWIDKIQKHSK